MDTFLGGFVLPLLLFTAATLNWSLISLLDLLAFLLIRFTAPKRGFRSRRRIPLLWSIFIFSLVVILMQVLFLMVSAMDDGKWGFGNAWGFKLIGFMKLESWRTPIVIYFLVVQLFVAFVASVEIRADRYGSLLSYESCWGNLSSFTEYIGSHVRVASCFLLPATQLLVGISNPSWISLPFFICSCVGLVDWSLTSNFHGLFRWWRPLWLYASFNICLLYLYQLPINPPIPEIFQSIAEFIGLYKISAKSEWPEICSSISLVLFYLMLSYAKLDLEELDFLLSTRECSMTDQLLPSKHSFFVRESRSGVRHTNVLLGGTVFRMFCINFFTYGFPVSLFALCFWSFHFASICAFGLLVYVGYVLYAFPSLFWLHGLNGLLLVFILLWAVSTYIFNVAFPLVNWRLGKDMEIWEMVGLWHYPIPGLFLLAQFCLGILVALSNLVKNSVLVCLSDEDGKSSGDNCSVQVKEETTVLIVATVAWGLRKCSRPIMLVLIFLIAMKPGFAHAVYIIFFLICLLGHRINKKIRQSMILLCEAHFAILYILQLDLISNTLEREGSLSSEILSQLGLLERDSSGDFLEIALLACLCAIHNHGSEMLFSFSAILQHAPCLPVGFSVLKAGLNKSVLLSVYASPGTRNRDIDASYERKIASYLSAIGEKFLSVYRSCGTYIAFFTILVAVYLMKPNYIAFGYIFLLLLWIIGRQLVEMTKRRLWFPLKAYSIVVFMLVYCLSIFPSLETWLSEVIDLHDLGFNSRGSLLQNVWESLAIMIVMQLYSYERRQSKHTRPDYPDPLLPGIIGFLRRFVIWHSPKILYATMFYAALSPISASGFLYLVGLVVCSNMPKISRIPSKSSLVYTGFLVITEYLFQMWGKQANMFPGQKNYDLARFLGLQVFERTFAGLEAGLRGKVLVIAACILQYNVFHWLQKVPNANLHVGKWEEPCPLFLCVDDSLPVVKISNGELKPSQDSNPLSGSRNSNSWHSFNSESIQSPRDVAAETGLSQATGRRKYTLGYFWGSSDSTKWNKKRILSLRKERFETQLTTLKIYLKFWMENMFNLFGLEMSMTALLMASFSLLNVISILYIALLAACILLDRRIVRKLWPMFVLFFACVLVLEYFALWRTILPLKQHSESESSVRCHDCWKSSDLHFSYCRNCWLGLTIDDPRMLISYFLVFMVASFKLHADHNSGFSSSSTYRQVMTQRKNAFVWRDLSFETKGLWTFIDYLRLYCYCHLLDLVLALILITGTLEYDVLHLGYLGFALVFFRMRFQILKKKNNVFKFLRIYNFIVIILSLAYQSPFLGDYNAEKCGTVDYIYEVIGFYKYDYGFRITSRSAIVEIIIFMLVSLQSYMFSSPEFDYVFRYLEAEQIGAIVNEEEKKAAWKKEQLQHIREAEEKKRQRNLQVEKMKSEMLNLQIQLHGMDSNASCGDISPSSEGLRRRSLSLFSTKGGNEKGDILTKEELNSETDNFFPMEFHEFPDDIKTEAAVESRKNLTRLSYGEITEFEEDVSSFSFNIDRENKDKVHGKENPLVSAVHFLGDGVSEIQSLGNQAVSNLVSFLNIPQEDFDSSDQSNGENVVHDERENERVKHTSFDHSSSLISDKTRSISEATSLQLGKILRYIWSQMRSNNDILCYCCFLVVFLWNFSLLSMIYVAALFLYALCVNTGPSYLFWVIMLIYTEAYILLQYLYQIIIHHCGVGFQSYFLYELGFPTEKITSSFVVHTLPLFLVYLFTLIQSSITAKDSEWFSSTEYDLFKKRVSSKKENLTDSSWTEKAREIMTPVTDVVKIMIRSFSIYWKSLTEGTESPPYFVQLSLDVHARPEDGIQPERIESGINQMLSIVHDERCKEKAASFHHSSSRVHVQSIEKSDENPNVVLAVLEVVYASPLTECNSADWNRSLTPAADVAKEILHAKNSGIVEEIGFPYPIFSVIGGGKRELDLYAYVFGADLAVFFLVSVFYQAVIENKSEFLEVYQLEDQFSKEFVFILMVIFFLIVVDRVIYLCSFAAGRVIFYLFNLVLFTYFVTEYAWNMVAPQREAGVFALRAIYLTKSVSLALQAIQVRNGVPHKSSLYRNFLTSNVSQVNYICYRLYRALPFLYELRCVLDWSCTTTSLTMYDWLKLEDINASLYLVKCDAILNRAKHRQGDKQTKITKFCSGICLFFILICIIWAPMLMYSSGNPTNIANPIKDASVQLDIKTAGGRLTLFQTTLCERIPWDIDTINLDPNGYLDAYDNTDIQLMCCQPDAATYWMVPNVVLNRFTKSINRSMDITFTWVLNRDRPKNKEVVKYENVVNPWDLPEPSEVQDVLKGVNNSFRVHNLYPRHFRLTGSGEIRPFDLEADGVSADLVMHHGNTSWWSFEDTVPLNGTECGGLAGPMAIIVSEETPQGFLGETLSKFSIWGLYISFVLAVGRFIRLQCSDLRMRIPYENLPSCDRLIAICEDIYAARAEGELGVEEVLYWTLIKIYRSPHMLLEYTKID
ncbi:piezo-type mechanosensitive ion channel homolog [Impatiens glandulifera]|uniref:piezo-type mechanosensitive ion channel homolog n=1 Tax=Impatiens glandulifera TaxID=253017 RepID=UPI001FB1496A|nr:piezo-type mechanosensitive ion channel homolog [Impatiens glandulifera]